MSALAKLKRSFKRDQFRADVMIAANDSRFQDGCLRRRRYTGGPLVAPADQNLNGNYFIHVRADQTPSNERKVMPYEWISALSEASFSSTTLD